MSRPNQTLSWPELTAILLVRLSVLWLLVLVSLTLSHDEVLFYALMGVTYALTIPYALWLRNRLYSQRLIALHFAVDFILAAGVIQFTGGIHSALTLLYPLVLLAAGIVTPMRQAIKVTALGILAYVISTSLLSRNVPMDYLPGGLQAELPSFGTVMASRVALFTLFGIAGTYISRHCAYSGSHIRSTRRTMRTLLEKLPTGVLLLDRAGRILFANQAAGKLLQVDVVQLTDRPFDELCASDRQPLPEHYGPSAWLQRTGSPPLPAALHRTDIELPGAAVPGIRTFAGTDRITLLALTDLSQSVEMEQQLTRASRTAAASRVAGDMAHGIRTPLTVISASIQLLQNYEKNARTSDWLPNSPRKRDRTELFNHILGASEEMDSAIQHFVDFTEYSPSDLLSIIKLDSIDQNGGYIGHLNTREKGFKYGQNPHSG